MTSPRGQQEADTPQLTGPCGPDTATASGRTRPRSKAVRRLGRRRHPHGRPTARSLLSLAGALATWLPSLDRGLPGVPTQPRRGPAHTSTRSEGPSRRTEEPGQEGSIWLLSPAATLPPKTAWILPQTPAGVFCAQQVRPHRSGGGGPPARGSAPAGAPEEDGADAGPSTHMRAGACPSC